MTFKISIKFKILKIIKLKNNKLFALMATFKDKPFFMIDKKANQVRLEIQKNPSLFILSDKEKRKAYAYGKRYSLIAISCSLYTFANIRRNHELLGIKKGKITPTILVPIISYNIIIAFVTYCLGHVFFYDRFKLFCHQLSMIEVQKYDRSKFNYDNYKYAILTPPVYSDEESNYGKIYFSRHLFKYDKNQLPAWIKRRIEANPDIAKETPAL